MTAKGEFSLKNDVFDWLESICFSIIAVLLIFTFFVRTSQVSGTSMIPTLQNGDRLLLVSSAYSKLKQGDIVVVTQPTKIGHPLIKRVIATEGQTIDINFENGHVYVDGILLHEDYIYEEISHYPLDGVSFPFKVSKGHVFVMGDNRNNSTDSREKIVGEIDERYIMGKAFFRLFPFDSFGKIK